MVSKYLPLGVSYLVRTKFKDRLKPITGVSKTWLHRKFTMWSLNDMSKDPEEWVMELGVIHGDMRKVRVKIGSNKLMTNILSNILE